MLPIAVIAGLTIKEAVRRRFIFAGILACLVFVIMAVIPIHARGMMGLPPELMPKIIEAVLATRGCSIIAFFGFLFAVALGSGTISGEMERGVLAVIVPKPIPRWSIYLGKWFGINLFIAPFIALWIIMLQLAIYEHVQHTRPALWYTFGVLMLYPVVFSSLTMMFSSISSTLLSTILPVMLAAGAWSQLILKGFGYMFDIATLKTMAKLVVWLAPLNPLSRWVERVIQPTALDWLPGPPGGAPPDPPAGARDMVWILVYAGVALVAGLVIFQRRDLGA